MVIKSAIAVVVSALLFFLSSSQVYAMPEIDKQFVLAMKEIVSGSRATKSSSYNPTALGARLMSAQFRDQADPLLLLRASEQLFTLGARYNNKNLMGLADELYLVSRRRILESLKPERVKERGPLYFKSLTDASVSFGRHPVVVDDYRQIVESSSTGVLTVLKNDGEYLSKVLASAGASLTSNEVDALYQKLTNNTALTVTHRAMLAIVQGVTKVNRGSIKEGIGFFKSAQEHTASSPYAPIAYYWLTLESVAAKSPEQSTTLVNALLALSDKPKFKNSILLKEQKQKLLGVSAVASLIQAKRVTADVQRGGRDLAIVQDALSRS